MIKIIDGKRYNTETADRICYMDNGAIPGDFRYYEAELYQTKRGAYSKMSIPVGNNASGGSSDITPIERSEAVRLVNQWSNDRDLSAKDAQEALKALNVEVEDA